MSFTFRLQTQVHAGFGSSRNLPGFLGEQGYSRLAVLVDENVAEHSAYYGEIKASLDGASTFVEEIRLRGSEEPDYDYLDSIADSVRSLPGIHCIVGLGGGSALDITKAVAALRTNPGRGVQYRGFDKLTEPPVPTIAIPTTAGTGSEVTINAVFTDKAEQRKLGINGRFMHATWAMLDGEWTMSCPRSVAVSSGMDALTHTLESYMCRQATPLTRALSREAFTILYRNLPGLVETPEDREVRQNLLYGSYLGAASLFNSGSGISGAFSYPLGVHYKIPHGICGGIFLPSVIRYNVERGYRDYADLLDLVEPHETWSDEEKSERFAVAIRELADKLEVPKTLSAWNIYMEDADTVAPLLEPLQGAFDQNPIPFSAKDNARALLEDHLETR